RSNMQPPATLRFQSQPTATTSPGSVVRPFPVFFLKGSKPLAHQISSKLPSVIAQFASPPPASRVRADLGLAFCTVLWGSTFVVVKNSLDHSSVFFFLALRFTVAAAVMSTWRPAVFRNVQRE